MSGYFVKDPDVEMELTVDWNRGYLQRYERVMDDLGWTVRPVEEVEGELRVLEQVVDGTCSRARFSGGVPGRIYMVASRVETTAGRVLERVILFRVAKGNCT